MQIISLNQLDNQSVTTTVNNQSCKIAVYYKQGVGLFMDLFLNGTAIFTGVLVRNRVLLVRQPYLGFVGDFIFMDTLGQNDPTPDGFGVNFFLCYLTPADVAANS